MAEGQTQKTALDVLLEIRKRRIEKSSPAVQDLLDEKLVTDVFREAWEHQFNEDPAGFQKAIRDIVGVAIDAKALKGAGQ